MDLKDYLENGIVVRLRNGDFYLVLNGKLLKHGLAIDLNKYNDKLKFEECKSTEFDINSMYRIKELNGIDSLMSIDNLDLYWERDPEIDWSKVPVDTKIWVRNDIEDDWEEAHFAEYYNCEIKAYYGGRTSFTGAYTENFAFAKIDASETDVLKKLKERM